MKVFAVLTIALLTGAAICGSAFAQRAAPALGSSPALPYAGQDARAVSTLSDSDIKQLLAGGGWGFAKPAELNGYPGPAHVLELADKLELTPIQKKRVELIFKRMQLRAKSLGTRYVNAEAALDQVFKSNEADTGALTTRLRDAERLRSELRRAHLQAHVETTPVLTPEQRKKYSELRGYGAGGEHAAGHQPQHKH